MNNIERESNIHIISNIVNKRFEMLGNKKYDKKEFNKLGDMGKELLKKTITN